MSIKNAIGRMIEARQVQARRYVNGALMSLDDDTLSRAGISRSEIKKQGFTAYPF